MSKEFTKSDVFAMKKTLNAYIMMQIAFDEVECLTDTSIFKHENKTRIKNTLSWLEKSCNDITNNMASEDHKNVGSIIDKVRSLLNEFELSFDQTILNQ